MNERYIASIDLGTSRIVLAVAQVFGEDVKLIYCRSCPSSGIRYSAVYVPGKVAGLVRKLIEEAEDKLGLKIFQVVVNYPKCDIHQEIAEKQAVRSRPEESITREEVENLRSMAVSDYPLGSPDTEKLYAAIPQSFSDDDNFQQPAEEIIGMISKELKGTFKLFVGKKSSARNIDIIFNGMDVAVARMYFTPVTTARAVLTEDETDNGVALIDFGGGSTSVTVYHRKVMRYYAAIPFGGRSVTNDIHLECTIPEQLAEQIKLAYGVCMPDRLLSLQDKILQIEDLEFNSYKQVPVQYLSQIITARIREIVAAILYEIVQSGYSEKLQSGVVITGGGAELANLVPFIREVSGYSVRTGRPRHLVSSMEQSVDMAGPAISNSIGMILAAKEEKGLNCVLPMGDGRTAPEEEKPAEQPEPAGEETDWGFDFPDTEEREPQDRPEGEEEDRQEPERREGPAAGDRTPRGGGLWRKIGKDIRKIGVRLAENLYDKAGEEEKES